MWRPRDRERYIGSYDPEHEMPDPDRGPGDRWQSDAYRRGARDTRFMYRADPNRFENRFNEQRDYETHYDPRWRHDARDMDRGGYGRGGGYDANFGGGGYHDYGRPDYGYGRDFDRYGHFDRDRFYGSDRGWDYSREEPPRFESDRDRWEREREERWRNRRY
jgi:hypothetical protein